ncbi:MAG: glycosyltransferase family 39 protein [Acidobacteriota bacterium]|nr:MAG: glycosyltransferase family 39 protein [Acidobacteriota bacterium]
MGPDTNEQRTRRATLVLSGLALAYFLLEWIPSFFGPYGHFIDELYYIACSKRLALGYVDHPPLSIVLLRLVRFVLGDSLPALRVVPAACGGLLVLTTGLLARRLGAGAFGQAIATGAAMVGSIYHVMFSFYSMNALSLLIWAACFLLLVEIERRDEPRLWLAFGAVAGLGLENKHTVVLLALGLAVGLVLTRARRHLAHRWLWIGLGLALLLLLPNIAWQIDNGWPSLEFYRNADLYKNVPTPPFEVLAQQVLFMNPAALPVWLAGLIFLLVSENGRHYRHLGWLFMTLLVLMLLAQKSRPDRISPAYTILFAGGGVLLEQFARHAYWRWLYAALPAALLVGGAAFLPLGVPLLPPQVTAAYGAATGVVPQIEQGEGKGAALPQWLADRFGWQELAEDVREAVVAADPSRRLRMFILAPSYGQAGAIEFFGSHRPPVHASQNNYFLWGPPDDSVEAGVVVGFRQQTLEQLFERVELFRVHDCEWCMPWRDESPIWIVRGQKVSFREVWPRFKHYE